LADPHDIERGFRHPGGRLPDSRMIGGRSGQDVRQTRDLRNEFRKRRGWNGQAMLESVDTRAGLARD
jgi:hypothetical protein